MREMAADMHLHGGGFNHNERRADGFSDGLPDDCRDSDNFEPHVPSRSPFPRKDHDLSLAGRSPEMGVLLPRHVGYLSHR